MPLKLARNNNNPIAVDQFSMISLSERKIQKSCKTEYFCTYKIISIFFEKLFFDFLDKNAFEFF